MHVYITLFYYKFQPIHQFYTIIPKHLPQLLFLNLYLYKLTPKMNIWRNKTVER